MRSDMHHRVVHRLDWVGLHWVGSRFIIIYFVFLKILVVRVVGPKRRKPKNYFYIH